MDQPTSASVTVDRGPFEMIPHWLLDEDISPQAIRLYLVLRRHGNRDGTSFPGRKHLAKQLHVSASTIDRAKAELTEVGAICERRRESEDGDWTSNLYHVHWDRIDGCRKIKGASDDYRSPVYEDTPPADEGTGPPYMANEPIPNKNLDPLTQTVAVADAPALTEGQLVNAITRTYTDRVPLSNFPAVAGVVRKAVRAQRYSAQQIVDALGRMVDDGRPVTTDALRIELEGLPTQRAKRSGTSIYLQVAQELRDERQADVMELLP
jgi:GntR family transcriptional regulator